MKTFLTALAIALAGATLAMTPDFADAKRLGAGKPAGMQRAAPPPATPTAPAKAPTQAAAPTTPPPTPAVAPKRSWMGPLAGLAAGIGLAALFSHFGMGEGMSNIIMMVLLALVAVVVVRWLMRRFAGGGWRLSLPPLVLVLAVAAGHRKPRRRSLTTGRSSARA